MSSAIIQNDLTIRVDIDEDATGGVRVTVPRDLRLTDIHCIATATSGGGAFTLEREVIVGGVPATVPLITGTLTCATANDLTRAGTLLNSGNIFLTSLEAKLLITANGAADRGVLIFSFIPNEGTSLTVT